jgi:hypothetical protein
LGRDIVSPSNWQADDAEFFEPLPVPERLLNFIKTASG